MGNERGHSKGKYACGHHRPKRNRKLPGHV